MTSTPHLPKDYAIPSIHCTLNEYKQEIHIIDRLVPHIRKCGILYTRNKVRLPHHTYVYAMDLNDRQREIIQKMMVFECYGLFERTVASDKWWVDYLNSKGHKNSRGKPIKRGVFQTDLKYLEDLKLIHRNTYKMPKIAQGGSKRNMTTAWGLTQYTKWVNKVRNYKGNVHVKPDSVKQACARYAQEVYELNYTKKENPLVLVGKKTPMNNSHTSYDERDNKLYTQIEKKPKVKAMQTLGSATKTLTRTQSLVQSWLKRKDLHFPESILLHALRDSKQRHRIVYALCSRQPWLRGLETKILDKLEYVYENEYKLQAKNCLRLAIALAMKSFDTKQQSKTHVKKHENYRELFSALKFEQSYNACENNLSENLVDMAKSLAFEIKDKFTSNVLANIGFEITENGILNLYSNNVTEYSNPYIFMDLMQTAYSTNQEILDYAKNKFAI